MFYRPFTLALPVAVTLLLSAALENLPSAHAQLAATSRDSSLTSVMGRGMTAYFNHQTGEAERLLSLVINAGSQDPRAYYFRALARQSQGRQYEAEQDMQIGASLEARNPAMGRSISRSLMRVQGETRRTLEHFRREGRLAQSGQAGAEIHARNQHRIQQEGYVLRKPAELRVDQLVQPSGVEIVAPAAQPSIQAQPSPQPAVAQPAAVTPPPSIPATDATPAPASPPNPPSPPAVESPRAEPQPAATEPDAAADPFGVEDTFAPPAAQETPAPAVQDKPTLTTEEAPATEMRSEAVPSDSGPAPAEALDTDPFGDAGNFSDEPAPAEPEAKSTPAEPAPVASTPNEPAATPASADDGMVSLPEESKIEPGKVLGVLRRVVGGVAPKPHLPEMPQLPDFGVSPAAAPGTGPAAEQAGEGVDVQPAPAENTAPADTPASEEDPFGDFDSFGGPSAGPATVEPEAAPPAAAADTAAEATMDGAANAQEEITQEEVAEETTDEQATKEEAEEEPAADEPAASDADDPFADDPFSDF